MEPTQPMGSTGRRSPLAASARRRAQRGRDFWAIFAAIHAFCLVATAQPKVLYEKISPYSTIVVTEDGDGLRTLSFERNGARQSVIKVGDPDHLELPYVRAMLVSLAMVDQPKRILVVGLGGGTIPSFLHRHYPLATIDAVDIDPDVVEVAKTFFGFREDERLRAHIRDGRKFIEQCEEPYDLIFLDAFSSDSIPVHLTTREFLHAVRQALTPRGLAVANLWSRGSNPLYDSMVNTYHDVFERLYLLDVLGAGNVILFAIPRREQFKRDELEQKAREITRHWQLPLDLGQLIRRGFGPTGPKRAGGRTLVDKPEVAPAGTPESNR
jgi:spermidine synthase